MENGEYVEKTSQDEVEQHTMAMCDGRFQLMENTPQMQDPMRSELGPLVVNSEAATAILNGARALVSTSVPDLEHTPNARSDAQ